MVKLRLNDSEADLIEALVNYTGQQKAPLLRDLLLEQARLVLAGEANYDAPRGQSEGPQRELFRAEGRPIAGTSQGPVAGTARVAST